jgi:hypothetical protein
MQLCRIIYYSLAAVHVSCDIFTHNLEHLNCITASGFTHYVAAGWYHENVGTDLSVVSSNTPAGSDIGV